MKNFKSRKIDSKKAVWSALVLFGLAVLAYAGLLIFSSGLNLSHSYGSPTGSAPSSGKPVTAGIASKASGKSLPDHAEEAALYKSGPMGDRSMGNPQAPIKIIEYASLTCGHCAIFQESAFPIIKKNYIEKGRVYYIFRNFPLDALALRASTYAQCMPKSDFFPYIEHLFKTNQQWIIPYKMEESFAELKRLTQQAGLTEKQMQACEESKEVKEHLEAVYENAKDALHVKGTPVFFINGEYFVAPDVLPQLKKLEQENSVSPEKKS